MAPAAKAWLVAAWAGYVLAPWYLADPLSALGSGGGLWLGLTRAPWLLPVGLALVAATWPLARGLDRTRAARWLVAAGMGGLAVLWLQGFAVGLSGWGLGLASLLGAPGPAQGGMGLGAAMTATSLLMLFCAGLAGLGWCRGDAFVTSSIGLVVALVGLFVLFPVLTILGSAAGTPGGGASPALFVSRLADPSIWGLGCLAGNGTCGVAWNTLFLAILVGLGTTLLGLAFALIATRTAFRYKKALRLLSLLPIITPPFVIGLALILLFGRSGAVSALLFDVFGVPRSRWIYGLPGILIAQLLAFTPIAFLVLIGVVQGISPSLEEASQTLRARGWVTFATITFPLLRPGLANAFLLGFVESMADFGNPLVLGGNYEVLSTKIFFAIVGASQDQGRAAVLATILLAFTLGAFWVQHAWLGKRSYTTVTGKGDSGLAPPLPRRVAWLCYATAIPWALFTFAVYAIILVGSFVKAMGRDYTPTFEHYLTGFRIEQTPQGLFFSGSAWNSLFVTLKVAVLSAPFTAAIGLLTAYLLTRQTFAGRRAFEFGTMVSFAVPGTVVGISYILAFNVPPVEITGTGLILIICFVFRNMPVAVRSGIASLSQIDKSLDEASHTLGARSFTTVWRVIVPLLRPALVAALVYSFVRAMTAVSAVIFLVSAEYNMATTYIVGRVEAGEFGLAIAYSTALVAVMLVGILLIQLLVGERRLGRRTALAAAPAPALASS
ncbi:ABC transporter permease [Salinarimonas soli]|uniref:Iron ABC transporter permease n=1 Tax=Salinarimonas soli TaxID=1638099 RepID=A0A5B2V775_9HYPH|nr:iron ABC transporter permease [Salinarimonas soli]KAA2234658.1 iron ABC transporter permease [Salinarimonas soli]